MRCSMIGDTTLTTHRMRYPAAYPTRAERMLRRETKTAEAIKCDPVASRMIAGLDHVDCK